MRLLACHIENFGVLSNQDFNFSEGLNITIKDNGWGKSTLAAFIKSMFYGLDGDGKRDDLANERKRYTPWQGGAFGGSLSFESKGKKYLINRLFGSKIAEDFFELRDLSTNLVSNDFSENIGQELFHINGESFLKTVFIRQNECLNAGTTDDINAKLGNISDGIDLNKFEAADSLLKDALNAYSLKRKTGELYKMADNISSLKASIISDASLEDAISRVETRLHDTRIEIERKKAELAAVTEKRAEVSGLEALAKEREHYDALVDQVSLKEKELLLRKDFFVKGVPAKELGKEWEEKCDAIETALEVEKKTELYEAEQNIYETYVNMFSSYVPTEQEIEEKLEKTKELLKLSATVEKYSLTDEEAARLRELKDNFGDINNFEGKLDDCVETWSARSGLISEANNINLMLEEANATLEKNKKNAKKKQKSLIIVGACLILAGILAGVFFVPCFAISVVGIVLILVALIKKQEKYLDNGAQIHSLKDRKETVNYELSEGESKVRELLSQNKMVYEEATVTRSLNDLSKVVYEYKNLLAKEKDAFENNYSDTCKSMDHEINSFLNRFGVYASKEEYSQKIAEIGRGVKHYESLRAKASDYEQAKRDGKRLTSELTEELALYGFETVNPIKKVDEILDCMEEYYSLFTLLEEAKNNLNQFAIEHDIERIKSLATDEEGTHLSLEELNQAEERLNSELEELRESHLTDTRTLDDYSVRFEEWREKKDRLSILEEELSEKKKRYDYVVKAESFLTTAREKLTARYMEPLMNGFKKYYSVLTGEEASAYHIDANTVITKEEQGKQRSTQLLSYGYRDLVGFCMRLSVADAMYTDEKPMLIMDDPFVNLDDRKVSGASRLIKEASKDYQIIYLTCREDRL